MYINEVEKFLSNISIKKIENDFSTLWDELLKLIPEFKICSSLPQDNPHHIYNVDKHILTSVAYINEENIELRLVMLFHDLGKGVTKSIDDDGIGHFYKHAAKSKDMVEEILVRLGYCNEYIRRIQFYIERHDSTLTKKSIRKLYNKIGYKGVDSLLRIKEADAKSQNPKFLQEKLIKIKELKEYLKEYRDYLKNNP